jgi:quercetin 2,3-dioxygenase
MRHAATSRRLAALCSIDARLKPSRDVITIRQAGERLRTRIGWLDSRHTFSFEEHIDPRHMGFRALRVMNEDRVAPGHGYGTHARRDVEIVTYVVEGVLRHHDSLGTEGLVAAGGLQLMSAGTGVLHSELNASDGEPLHLLQIWMTPERTRLAPSYEQRAFPFAGRRGRLTLVASRDGRDGSVTIHQDVAVFSCLLQKSEASSLVIQPGRHVWVQVIRGSIQLNGVALTAGDGACISDEAAAEVRSSSVSETLLFDLA